MRTETNWEDAQLMREAARAARQRTERAKQISDTVAEHLTRLRTALREDFHLTDQDSAARIIANLSEFEKCDESGCTRDAVAVTARYDGPLLYHCSVHEG